MHLGQGTIDCGCSGQINYSLRELAGQYKTHYLAWFARLSAARLPFQLRSRAQGHWPRLANPTKGCGRLWLGSVQSIRPARSAIGTVTGWIGTPVRISSRKRCLRSRRSAVSARVIPWASSTTVTTETAISSSPVSSATDSSFRRSCPGARQPPQLSNRASVPIWRLQRLSMGGDCGFNIFCEVRIDSRCGVGG